MKELFQRNTKLQNIKVCQDGDELVIFHTDNKYSKVGKTIAYRLPAKYIYCLQCYEMPFYILKEVKRLLQIEKDSNIPPTVNTDTKSESCVIADSVGVVDSVGDTLFASDFKFSQIPHTKNTDKAPLQELEQSNGDFVTCDGDSLLAPEKNQVGKFCSYCRHSYNNVLYEACPFCGSHNHDDDENFNHSGVSYEL